MPAVLPAPSTSRIAPVRRVVPSPVTPPFGRDVRLDFFRGMALVAIAVNHTVPPPALFEVHGHYRFGQALSFNFADVFVFVSGVACALAYGRRVREDLADAWKRALRRCGQIYLAALAALAVVVPIVLVIQRLGGGYAVTPAMTVDVADLASPWTWLRVALLDPPWPHFGILQFYVLVVAVMPGVLWLYGRSRLLAVGASTGLWALANAADRLGWPAAEATTRTFCNPFAWQLLFCLGLFLGVERRRRGERPMLEGRGRAVAVTLAAGVLLLGDYLRQSAWAHFHLDDKDFLGPLRVAELLAVAAIVSQFVRRDSAALSKTPLSWLTAAGRHSLPVFAASIVMAYAMTHLAAAAGVGRPGYLIAVAVAGGATLTFGVLLDRHRGRGPATTAPSPANAFDSGSFRG